MSKRLRCLPRATNIISAMDEATDPLVAKWLDSRGMNRQGLYHAHLQEIRADQACKFLLEDAAFIKWHRATDSRELVLLGDMGSGKSVAMSFLVDELRRRNEHQLPQPKVCYFYCRHGETSRPADIFSVLILSLLQQLPGTKKPFCEWYKKAASRGMEPAADSTKLEEWLQQTLETLDRTVYLVIDGLDECDQSSRNSLLESMRNISRKAPRLKILLSTRPQEEILDHLSNVPKIELGPDATRDRIIAEKTVERQLSYLSEEAKALVTEALSRLARGSAIWTMMTVELLEGRGIRALGPMRTFLKDIPQPRQLSRLYADLFSQCTLQNRENQILATTALEILAIARRPLSMLELAWAVALSAATEPILSVHDLSQSVDRQRVMSLIQPFIACVDFGDARKRQVRLVHQSVKQFVLQEWTSHQPDLQSLAKPTTPAAATALSGRRTAHLEARILKVCIRYLLLREIGDTSLFSEEQVATEALPQDCDLFGDRDPASDYDPHCTWEVWEDNMIRYDPTHRGFGELFVYASCYWVEHFGGLPPGAPLPLLGDVEKLCQAGSTRLHNWIEQNRRPDCTLKPRFVFDSSLYDPLGITALYGSDAMLRHMLEASELHGDPFLSSPAVGAAEQILQWGDVRRLWVLWTSKIGCQLESVDFFRRVLRQWSDRADDKSLQDWHAVFKLVKDASDVEARQRWAGCLLYAASQMGYMPIIRQLMRDRGQNPHLDQEVPASAE